MIELDKLLTQHNYTKAISKLIHAGVIGQPGTEVNLLIVHDGWCSLLNGGTRCNCNPDLLNTDTGEVLNGQSYEEVFKN